MFETRHDVEHASLFTSLLIVVSPFHRVLFGHYFSNGICNALGGVAKPHLNLADLMRSCILVCGLDLGFSCLIVSQNCLRHELH